MVSRFLLLMALSVCVSGTLVVKVAHSSYQAEVDQDLTLEWTFTPRPDSSLQTLNIFCSMFNPQKDLVLLNLHKGVEVPQKEGDFVGRVQCDKEVLKEGQIRLHLSSLKTEDSGWYQCDVLTEYGKSLDRCSLNVTGTLVVKVTNSSYQAKVDQNLTLEWTFTPKPDSSLQTLNIFCDMFNNKKDPVLFHLHKGVEVPQKEGDFVGRVQCDKEVLKEGQIRLHVSSLRTEDSGWYQCEVLTESGISLDRCFLNVTAAKNQSRSEGEAESLNTEMWGLKDIAIVITVGTIVGAALVCIPYCCITRSPSVCDRREKKRRKSNGIEVITKTRLYHD
ncbi:uncharacterized protein LOC122870162 isoform X2 [Xyrichtys novacula]|uniref:Uncharacterized protein LOC122870162 isoform X2 n=1 Tax=Xyrichtys novacula TaxID=13765 RepID=A0AAV1HIW9_XYRNO|nr:uncharacterized protein LOC122870162 isoform X2 [Xyrichtys novacula]